MFSGCFDWKLAVCYFVWKLRSLHSSQPLQLSSCS